MDASMERTRRHLRAALDEQLRLYEAYVPNARILGEYVRTTKQMLLDIIDEVFEGKIRELTQGAPLPKSAPAETMRGLAQLQTSGNAQPSSAAPRPIGPSAM